MMYWQQDIETLSRDRLEKLQLERLKATLDLAYNSPFYKKTMDENGISSDSIHSLDDLKKIPFTTKNDLRSHYFPSG
ncbi:hypothetical protein FACS189441_6430 [Betaproteobacteria bacterium]|nr:hypothetical protein FACS189441_6430 [Betaproteobacteria bacterium]